MANESGKLKDSGSTQVRIVLEDGTLYPLVGKLLFTDLSVDPTSGQVTLRAEVPNPQTRLLPGMYVRAVLAQAVDESALLVPQQAVNRDTRGTALALVVGADNKVGQRELTVEPAANQWRVLTGLKAGERVVVQGQLKAKPGKVVRPVIVELGAPAP